MNENIPSNIFGRYLGKNKSFKIHYMIKLRFILLFSSIQLLIALFALNIARAQKADNIVNQYLNEGSFTTLFNESKPNSLYEQAPKTEIFVGISSIFEKSLPGYTLVGFNGAYTRYIDANFGATVEAGYYAAKADKNSYTRALMMVGGSYYLDIEQVEGLNLAPYALIGLARVTADIAESNVKATNGAFTSAIGTSINYEVNPLITIGLRADINPTIYNGFVNSPLRLGLGLVFRSN